MSQKNSISFDEVLGLLRGQAMSEFEASYAASRGYTVSQNWGDSLALTNELAFAGATRDSIQKVLVSRSHLLGKYMDALLSLSDDGEEWPAGEESDDDDLPQKVASNQPRRLGCGFSIMAACSIWLLAERSESELESWLKFRRIPHHKKHAQDLRRIFSQGTDDERPLS